MSTKMVIHMLVPTEETTSEQGVHQVLAPACGWSHPDFFGEGATEKVFGMIDDRWEDEDCPACKAIFMWNVLHNHPHHEIPGCKESCVHIPIVNVVTDHSDRNKG